MREMITMDPVENPVAGIEPIDATQQGAFMAVGAPSPTLWDAEAFLIEMLDTEGAVDPAVLEDFRQVLQEALKTAVEKRDHVGQFILQTEAREKMCRAEAERVTKRARILKNTAERVREYVLAFIESQPLDAKGKPKKLEGSTVNMSARAKPAKVDVANEAEVPLAFKDVTVTMPASTWEELLDAAGGWKPAVGELPAYAVNLDRVKTGLAQPCTACNGKDEVCEVCYGLKTQQIPGVSVVVGGYSLVVK